MQTIGRILSHQNHGLFSIANISRTHSRQRHFKVVMIAHGASTWSEDQDKFCGWYDAPLSKKGRNETINAGLAIKEAGLKFDISFTSFLTRAQIALANVLKETGQFSLPTVKSWRLNEKHTGELTGLRVENAISKYGEKKVVLWYNDYDACPPPMQMNHKYYSSIVDDPRYVGYLSTNRFPVTESFKMAGDRALVFWHEVIEPVIKRNQRVLILAHRNSLRGIIKYLENVSDEDAMKLNIPTGIPFVFTLNMDLVPLNDAVFLKTKKVKSSAQRKIN